MTVYLNKFKKQKERQKLTVKYCTKCLICENVIAIVSKTNKSEGALFVKASIKHGVIKHVLALVKPA